jgi:hypothetical protein
MVLRENANGSRVAYVPADIDRCFARGKLPDHGQLIQNIVRWALNAPVPLAVEGPGFIDCQLYSQPGRLILHLVNLTNTMGGPIYEIVPIGPVKVSVSLRVDVTASVVRSLVSKTKLASKKEDGCITFTIERITDHEVLIIE